MTNVSSHWRRQLLERAALVAAIGCSPDSSLGGNTGGAAVATGGSVAATGGASFGAGGRNTGGTAGGSGSVVLTASYDGQVRASWYNGTDRSVFLPGCATVELWQLQASGWVNLGPGVACTWEGVAVEVPAGQTHLDPYGGAPRDAGTYRLGGKYGVGCTPGVALSQAGCVAMLEATSNELVLPGTGTGGAPSTGGAPATGGKAPSTGGAGGTGGIPGLHEACVNDRCATGLTPTTWYGISGDPFCTCEIPCAGTGAACPNSLTCVCVSDGPCNVCMELAI